MFFGRVNFVDRVAAMIWMAGQSTTVDPALAEQIVRLHVTHPGVTVDGIMTKMGL